jgi:hypothetical protein
VTFADSNFKNPRERITQQAKGLNFFTNIYSFDEGDLDKNFFNRHKNFIESNKRGYGYWIWKPQVVKQVLAQVPDGSIIIYADAGCAFSDESELNDLISKIDDKGFLGFQFKDDNDYHNETKFNKKDCIDRVFPNMSGDTPQIIATTFIIKKNKFTCSFIDTWLKYCEEYHLVDDSESVLKNADSFVEHRHDQSIFSLLCKIHGLKTLPNTVDYNSGPIKKTGIRN